MGRQVNFFMLDSDERQLRDQITALGGDVIRFANSTPEIHVCPVLPPPDSEAFWDELSIVPPDRMSGIRLYQIQRDQTFRVDEDNSPAIQFHRCRRGRNVIHRGRIWAALYANIWSDTKHLEERIYKGDDFKRFYESLAGWIKRHYRREPHYGFYCGPEAWEALQRGASLTDE